MSLLHQLAPTTPKSLALSFPEMHLMKTQQTDILPFTQNTEPRKYPNNVYTYSYLNEPAISNQYDPKFAKVSTCACPSERPCSVKEGYIMEDPRLLGPTGEYTILDTPPLNGGVLMKDVYSEKMNKYHCGYYSDYSSIENGDIMYYTDSDVSDPFIKPVFSNSAEVTGYVYKTPMEGYRPYYYRQPLVSTNVIDTNAGAHPYNLTFMRDSEESREDIMSKQMDRMNRSKYTARWGNQLLKY
jgi:hypothetical protein